MKYKYIIWDFNGTILDDTGVNLIAINKVLKKRSLPLLKDCDELREIFCFPVKEYYRRLGMDFSKEPYEIPADEWVEEYKRNVSKAKITTGIPEALAAFKNAGLHQIILSASETEMLKEQIEALGISDSFNEILGCDNVYAGGKVHIGKSWIERMTKEKVFPALLIGDTDHDLSVAREIGCDCVLFSHGCMSKSKLSKLSVPVFDSFSEITDFVLNS